MVIQARVTLQFTTVHAELINYQVLRRMVRALAGCASTAVYQVGYQSAHEIAQNLRNFAPVHSVRNRGTECTVDRERESKTSGSSEAWYRARFGTERSRVRIPPSPRPLHSGPCRGSIGGTVHQVQSIEERQIHGRRTALSNSSRNCPLWARTRRSS